MSANPRDESFATEEIQRTPTSTIYIFKFPYLSVRRAMEMANLKFCTLFISILRNKIRESYFFEIKPIRSFQEPFEFSIIINQNSRQLDRPSDPSSFRQHFSGHREKVVTFFNLSNDTVLVAPTPNGRDYSNLYNFVNNSTFEECVYFFKVVGTAVLAQNLLTPLYVFTHGTGVPWLHMRISHNDKYIQKYRK